MSVYFDVSVLVALFALDALNDRADRSLRTMEGNVIVSDFAAAEFSSVIATRVRTRDLRPDEARNTFSNFDTWSALHARRVELTSADVASATALVRRLDLSLRAPDALHIAIVQRIGSRLLTFDRAMMAAARTVRVNYIKI